MLELSLPSLSKAAVKGRLREPAPAENRVDGRRIPPTVRRPPRDGSLILLVDDHPINRMVLIKQIKCARLRGTSFECGATRWRREKQGIFARSSRTATCPT